MWWVAPAGRPVWTGLRTSSRPCFAHVTNDMTIAREEIFGPVLCILGYDDIDHAVAIANDTEYGLAGFVSGADGSTRRDGRLPAGSGPAG